MPEVLQNKVEKTQSVLTMRCPDQPDSRGWVIAHGIFSHCIAKKKRRAL